MSLRRRLTLLVALTIVVPITAVGVTVVNLIANEGDQRAFDRLSRAVAFTESLLADQATDVERSTEALVADPRILSTISEGGEALESQLRRALVEDDLDLVLVEEGSGEVVAAARREPVFASDRVAPSDADLVEGLGGRRAVVSLVALPGGGHLLGGRWLDNRRIETIARTEGIGLALVDGREPVAASAPLSALPDRPLRGEFRASFGDAERFAVASQSQSTGLTVLAFSPPPEAEGRTRLVLIFGALLLVITVLIVLVGHVVSGLVTGPVEELANAALAVSRGDLSQRVEPSGDIELASLGRAFNQMTDNLRAHVEELEQSRTEFQAAMARLGDVLVSTHDIRGIIDVVLEACTLTLRAEEAIFFERVAMPARIRAKAAQSWAVPDLELNATGVAGAAAVTLGPVMFPGGAELAPGEPPVAAAMAVPVVSEGRLFGVIAVYGRSVSGQFRKEDMHTLQTLARQTEVAVGNVILHDETRRQARTDGTTGLWNRREFELRCRESVKEAARFKETFGVILADIDDFKQVNDLYDHSTGDAALIWLASRLSEATREIDTVARWGGEEFIVLLPRAGLDETATVAERVRAAVAAEPIVDGTKIIPLTVSIGYAIYPQDGDTADGLFRAADTALLRAKRMGKNRVERATTEEGAA